MFEVLVLFHVVSPRCTVQVMMMMMMSYSEDWISRKFTNKLLTSLYNLQDVTTIQETKSYIQLAYNTK